MIILGLDPGSRFIGYGIIEKDQNNLKHLDHGVLKLPGNQAFLDRLVQAGQQLAQVVGRYEPDAVVVEKIFVGKNVDSAFKLGHVRGLCLFQAGQFGAQVFEYAARSVKKGVTGHGGASKEQVRMLLNSILGIPINTSLDASDALGLAYYHGQKVDMLNKLSRMQVDL